MGGYAVYVWGSYAVAAVVLAANVLWPLARGKTVRRGLKEFHRLRNPES